MHRHRLQMVPQAGGTAHGAGDKGPSRTDKCCNMLGTSACYCGPGRTGGSRYICLTCAGFARIGRCIHEREPHRYTEQRSA